MKQEMERLRSLLPEQQRTTSDGPFRIDLNVFQKQDYVRRRVDIGELFLNYQRSSTNIVNKLNEKATLENISNFL